MPTATSSPQATSIPLPRLSPTTSPNLLGWRASEAPTIDGNLEEWGDISAYVATHRTHQDVSWDGTEDLVPVWQLKWDDRFFYVGVAVTDDRHVQTRQDDQVYRGDSVEVQLDTDPFTDAGVAELSPDEYQLIFSPGDFQDILPIALRLRGDFPSRFQGAVLNATDNDTPGTAVQEFVVSSIEGRRYADPTTWGMITFVDR